MEGDQEGSSRRTVAVAESDDLRSWEVHPVPVLSYADAPGDNIYVNGAVVTPDGRIVLMYAVQQYPSWLGFMMASADDPKGPFAPYSRNPVYRHFNDAAHEFDLLRVDHPELPVRHVLCRLHAAACQEGWPGRGPWLSALQRRSRGLARGRAQSGVRTGKGGRLGRRTCPAPVPEPDRRYVVSLVRRLQRVDAAGCGRIGAVVRFGGPCPFDGPEKLVVLSPESRPSGPRNRSGAIRPHLDGLAPHGRKGRPGIRVLYRERPGRIEDDSDRSALWTGTAKAARRFGSSRRSLLARTGRTRARTGRIA